MNRALRYGEGAFAFKRSHYLRWSGTRRDFAKPSRFPKGLG